MPPSPSEPGGRTWRSYGLKVEGWQGKVSGGQTGKTNDRGVSSNPIINNWEENVREVRFKKKVDATE